MVQMLWMYLRYGFSWHKEKKERKDGGMGRYVYIVFLGKQ